MGRFSDRWREFIAKVRLMQPDGIKKLLLVGVYVNILLLIVVDIVSFITVSCITGSILVSVIVMVGLLVHRLHE